VARQARSSSCVFSGKTHAGSPVALHAEDGEDAMINGASIQQGDPGRRQERHRTVREVVATVRAVARYRGTGAAHGQPRERRHGTASLAVSVLPPEPSLLSGSDGAWSRRRDLPSLG
jgi:hypothetical protein